jgi:hypothetical protein
MGVDENGNNTDITEEPSQCKQKVRIVLSSKKN